MRPAAAVAVFASVLGCASPKVVTTQLPAGHASVLRVLAGARKLGCAAGVVDGTGAYVRCDGADLVSFDASKAPLVAVCKSGALEACEASVARVWAAGEGADAHPWIADAGLAAWPSADAGDEE